MLSRLMKSHVEHQSRNRGAPAPLPAITPGATAASTMHKTLSAGMGTTNFVNKILDIYAELDRDRKQQLINYSTVLVEEQRAGVRVEQGGAPEDRGEHSQVGERAQRRAALTANLEQMAQRLAASRVSHGSSRVSDGSEAAPDFSKTAS